METPEAIIARAHERGRELKLPYAGALLPKEAHALMCALPESKLVDVRSRAELECVGRIPDSVAIEWNRWPNSHRNLDFISEFEASVDKNATVMLLCRSGVRSHHAAVALAANGYSRAYNILQGFEGDKDPNGQRNLLGGWRAAGLPWKQG
ncbi:MAG: rhodanese-like domain-containing protein [Burkholderiales bacterium]|nr:rhodanese-like domain-containing protein [Burkholderiales bacterium]